MWRRRDVGCGREGTLDVYAVFFSGRRSLVLEEPQLRLRLPARAKRMDNDNGGIVHALPIPSMRAQCRKHEPCHVDSRRVLLEQGASSLEVLFFAHRQARGRVWSQSSAGSINQPARFRARPRGILRWLSRLRKSLSSCSAREPYWAPSAGKRLCGLSSVVERGLLAGSP